MVQIGTIQSNKTKNELFFDAVEYLYSEKLVASQQELAAKIGISPSAFSRIKSGVNTVSDDTIRKMNDAFGNIFNMAYFRDKSGFLLAKQVKDLGFYHGNGQSNQSESTHINQQQSAPIDDDFYHKTLDLNAQIIADLRKDLEYFKSLVLDKDGTIQDNAEQIISLQSRLSATITELEHTKTTLAAVRKNFDDKVAEVDQLRVELEKSRDPLAHYPFHPGVAEDGTKTTHLATDE